MRRLSGADGEGVPGASRAVEAPLCCEAPNGRETGGRPRELGLDAGGDDDCRARVRVNTTLNAMPAAREHHASLTRGFGALFGPFLPPLAPTATRGSLLNDESLYDLVLSCHRSSRLVCELTSSTASLSAR